MSSSVIELLVLAGIAIFLILRLKNVLGTRGGFEKPPVQVPAQEARQPRPDFEVIEGGPDRDIVDHVDSGSPAAEALAKMKAAEPAFIVGEFLQGARGAYEMILMAFERGDLSEVRDFLAPEVHDSFLDVIQERERQGLTIDANFVGIRELVLVGAAFDDATREGEVTVRFTAEVTSVVRDVNGTTVEGDPNLIKRQRDIWTFGRVMGSDDPNWQLVATGA
ncbi:Tim44/TimA family putative adaptor protein [Mangrovicoccus algicola]|uniref:Tim44 domain-containing protein n=1 Tax=Mangrovicoccus algicola TaxID=2771008 RepID=A0A8J7CZQ6_9RHOB|nr:Tim44/TimA family putative adaptor protein [Mangrovicoccus algicola]MBE3638263.1 Tim44 domain-containing protein [Mangrovicoccus algicola]